MIDLETRPYIQITRPFLKWLLPFFAVTSGAVASFGTIPFGLALFKFGATLILFCFLIQGICIRVTNDIFDVDVDKLSPDDEYAKFRPIAAGIITKSDGSLYAVMGYFLALLLSYSLGTVIFTITVLTLITQFLYSVPPVRFKRFFPINNITIGIFYCGAFFLAGWSLYQPINSIAINAAILLTILGVVGSMTKDYSDVDGDGMKGIKTLPVIFGMEKSGKINTVLFITFYIITAFFILFGLLPLYSLLIFISVPFLAPGIHKMYNLNARTPLNERKKVMSMLISSSFLIFVLMGISLVMGAV